MEYNTLSEALHAWDSSVAKASPLELVANIDSVALMPDKPIDGPPGDLGKFQSNQHHCLTALAEWREIRALEHEPTDGTAAVVSKVSSEVDRSRS